MFMSSRALAIFLGSLVLATWAVQGVALALVGDPDSPAMTPWLLGSMLMPSLWSIVYLAFFNRNAWSLVRLRPGNPVYLLLGALIPGAIAFAVLAVVGGLGWGASSFFDFSTGVAKVLRGPWMLGDGTQGWGLFAANMAATAIVFAGINGVVALGEEFGWRGVLQHHMIERLGFVRGVALLGFVWAIWHAPLNLAGYNHPEAPLYGTFVLFPVQLIAESFIMAWLTLRARSFWPAVLMHGSGNGIGEGVMSSLTLGAGVPPLAAEYVMLGLTIVLALVCLALSVRSRRGCATIRPLPTGDVAPPWTRRSAS